MDLLRCKRKITELPLAPGRAALYCWQGHLDNKVLQFFTAETQVVTHRCDEQDREDVVGDDEDDG